jgi:ABC-type nitrate/sulfonate/bicarbonate transport system permease component
MEGKKIHTEEENLYSAVMMLNVLKGGHISPEGKYIVGPHLQLLSQFFIGYKVSFMGSIIGFLYGFAFGTIFGTLIGWIYNKIVELRK